MKCAVVDVVPLPLSLSLCLPLCECLCVYVLVRVYACVYLFIPVYVCVCVPLCDRIFTAIMPMVAAGLIPDDPTLQPIRRLISLVRPLSLVGLCVTHCLS